MDGQSGGVRFEQGAQTKRLAGQGRRDRGDEGAPARAVDHQPELLQAPERLADGRLADPHLLGDVRLDEALAGCERPQEDRLLDGEGDLLPEDGAAWGREYGPDRILARLLAKRHTRHLMPGLRQVKHRATLRSRPVMVPITL